MSGTNVFTGNKAGGSDPAWGYGGAIAAEGIVNIQGPICAYDNTATVDGGFLYVDATGTLEATGGPPWDANVKFSDATAQQTIRNNPPHDVVVDR